AGPDAIGDIARPDGATGDLVEILVGDVSRIGRFRAAFTGRWRALSPFPLVAGPPRFTALAHGSAPRRRVDRRAWEPVLGFLAMPADPMRCIAGMAVRGSDRRHHEAWQS